MPIRFAAFAEAPLLLLIHFHRLFGEGLPFLHLRRHHHLHQPTLEARSWRGLKSVMKCIVVNYNLRTFQLALFIRGLLICSIAVQESHQTSRYAVFLSLIHEFLKEFNRNKILIKLVFFDHYVLPHYPWFHYLL